MVLETKLCGIGLLSGNTKPSVYRIVSVR